MKLTLPVVGQRWINNDGEYFDIVDVSKKFIKRDWNLFDKVICTSYFFNKLLIYNWKKL